MDYFKLFQTLLSEGLTLKEAFEIVQIIKLADSGELFRR
jgi:hypothetical protein